MPTYYARKAGNINAADVWATTPSGTASAVTFASGDVLMANSFAIAINVSTDLGGAGQVRNDTTGGATAGGGFTLSNGVTLTANVFASNVVCVTFSGSSGNQAAIIGNCTAGTGTAGSAATNTSTGTLSITGNCTGGNVVSGFAFGANNTSSGTLTIVGNCLGGVTGLCHGANNNSNGTLNITGNVTGVNTGHGVNNNSTGTVNITGNCTGGAGSHGANNALTGIMTIVGPVSQGGNANLTGGSSVGFFGANNASTGSMFVTGPIYASEFDGGVGSANRSGLNLLTGPFYTSTTWGVNPIRCVSWRWATNLVNTTFIEVPTANLAAKRNLVTPDNATNFPAPADVRSGTPFGIEGALVGTCAVPLPAQVAPGVSIDNTIGTLPTPSAAQNAAAVRQELAVELARIDAAISSRLAPSGTLATVTNLTNAPASVTPSDIWSHSSRTLTSASGPTAVEIRQELDSNSSKLSNLDASVSSRMAASEATKLDAVKVKTDALNTERLANVATTAIVGNLIAQSNS